LPHCPVAVEIDDAIRFPFIIFRHRTNPIESVRPSEGGKIARAHQFRQLAVTSARFSELIAREENRFCYLGHARFDFQSRFFLLRQKINLSFFLVDFGSGF
jgi:hypothetical protein